MCVNRRSMMCSVMKYVIEQCTCSIGFSDVYCTYENGKIWNSYEIYVGFES